MKNKWWTLLTILAVIAIAIFILKPTNGSNTSEELAKCIGQSTVLYTQLGCHACKTQEEMFGETYQYLTVVDCFVDRELCLNKNIKGTPSWGINNKIYIGVKSLEKLKELTGC